MPKQQQDHIAKTARVAPYPGIGLQAANAATYEAAEGLAVVEADSAYDSNTETSQESIELNVTHPRCYGNDHVEKLETFTQDLDQALKNSFPPKAQKYPYTGVFVLLLRWMDDDLQVQREITKLSDVFATQFSFEVEQWQIPSTNPTRALQAKLYDFQNSHPSEEELLIVYYGGHSEADSRRGRSLWRANNRSNSPSLNWSSLQHLLETAVPYVLIILDCCFAANAARDTAEGTTKEILAACGRENPTLGVCERSFTSVLVEELQAFGRAPFTVAMLHSRLVTMRWRLAFTPIYALLSENGGNSNTICPVFQPYLHRSSRRKLHHEGAICPVLRVSCLKFSKPLQVSLMTSSNTLLPRSDKDSLRISYSHILEYFRVSVTIPLDAPLLTSDKFFFGHFLLMCCKNVIEYRQSYSIACESLLSSMIILTVSTKVPQLQSPLAANIGWSSQSSTNPSSAIELEGNCIVGQKSTYPTSSQGTRDTRVLLSVSLAQDAELDLASWTAWLSTTVPWDILKLDVHLESVFRSHSTLVLISIPTSGWNLLTERSAYRFVGFVRSRNLIARVEDQRGEQTEKRRQSKRLEKNRLDRDLFDKTAASKPRKVVAVYNKRQESLEPRTKVKAPPQEWTPEKDSLLKSARRQGLNWQIIASQFFPDKTPNACRKRHERLIEEFISCVPSNAAINGDNARMRFLRETYSLHRKQMWEIVAGKVGMNWEMCEAKCMAMAVDSGQRNVTESMPQPTSEFSATGMSFEELMPYDERSKPPTAWIDALRLV